MAKNGEMGSVPGMPSPRPPSQPEPGRLEFLDSIRGIAISAVFLFHALGATFSRTHLQWNGLWRDFTASESFLSLLPITYGGYGVAVFFAISGFCIHLSHQRSANQSWGVFFCRRFFRIYPPYLAALCLFFFFWPFGYFPQDPYPKGPQFFLHLFLVHNFTAETFYGINQSFWSIAVEAQLYIIYPLLLLGVRSWGWSKMLAAAAALEVGLRLFGPIANLPHMITTSPFAYWFSWSIGAHLAETFRQNKPSPLAWIRFDFVLVVALFLPFFQPLHALAFPAFALLSAVAMERLISRRWDAPAGIIWRHLAFLGVVSYSFYLFHQPMMGLTTGALLHVLPGLTLPGGLRYFICLGWYVPILGLSFLAFRLLERPSISLGAQFAKIIQRRREAGFAVPS